MLQMAETEYYNWDDAHAKRKVASQKCLFEQLHAAFMKRTVAFGFTPGQ